LSDGIYIRTSKHSLMLSNTGKIEMLDCIFIDYENQLRMYIQDILEEKIPLKSLLSSPLLPGYTIHHSGWKQIIYKQASEIVRSNINYTRNRTFKRYKKVYSYFLKNGRQYKFTSKHFKELNINYKKRIKINLKNINISLDSRVFNIQNNFLLIKTPYSKSIKFPVQLYNYMKKYNNCKRKNTVRLSNKNGKYYVNYFWECKTPDKKTTGKKIGIDIGYNKLISTSEGEFYGKELKDLYNRIAKKQRGSRRYEKLLKYKTDEINRLCKKLVSDTELHTLYVEDLKLVKNNTKLSTNLMNKMQYWSYRQVLEKLGFLSEMEGFQVTKVAPAYTSQRCSCCGVIMKTNRKGEYYKCSSCGVEMDADYNAAINILQKGDMQPLLSEIN